MEPLIAAIKPYLSEGETYFFRPYLLHSRHLRDTYLTIDRQNTNEI